MVQIETREGLQNAPEIARVDHVDILFIGPGDLATALGQPGVVTGARMDEARRRVLDSVNDAGKSAGIFAYSLELACQYLEEGFLFVAIGNDLKFLRAAILQDLSHVQRLAEGRVIGDSSQRPGTMGTATGTMAP
jgi:4-hydroxy-2-oxoheptanedioate aldolase